jgi:hypothetical protein
MAKNTDSKRNATSARTADRDVSSVCELLDRIDVAAAAHDQTSIGDVLREVGERSFGPLLLLAGLVMLAPVIGDIPGVPVLMGLIVILSAAQFLVGRDHLWLPEWLLRRSAAHRKIQKGVRWVRPVARFLDRWSKPRLSWMTRGGGYFVSGAACVVIAAATPLMEVVPFSANLAGIAIAAYGLALIASDGAIALLASAFSAAAFVLIGRQMLSS